MLQRLQVSFSHPLSYFSLLLFLNIKFDRFCFIDAFMGPPRKMRQKKIVFFSCLPSGSFTEKEKLAEGSLVCHFGEKLRECDGSVLATDLTSPP